MPKARYSSECIEAIREDYQNYMSVQDIKKLYGLRGHQWDYVKQHYKITRIGLIKKCISCGKEFRVQTERQQRCVKCLENKLTGYSENLVDIEEKIAKRKKEEKEKKAKKKEKELKEKAEIKYQDKDLRELFWKWA